MGIFIVVLSQPLRSRRGRRRREQETLPSAKRETGPVTWYRPRAL